MNESRLELKVGGLVVASALALLALLWLMGELRVGGEALLVDFSHTGNVVAGAPVKLSGIGVGTVKSVNLLPSRRNAQGQPLPVQMTLRVEASALKALRHDASITISTQGPLGEPYLELWPGTGEQAYDVSTPIRGTDAPRLDLVTNRLASFLDAASDALEKDPEAVSKLLTGVGRLTVSLDTLLNENRGDVRAVAQELVEASKHMRALAVLAHAQLEPGGLTHALIDDAAGLAKTARAEVPELTKRASTALGGLAAVSGQLTEADGQRLKSMLAKYEAVGEKLEVLAARADRLSAKLEAGEGSVGALLKDKQVYDDLKTLLTDLRKHPWKMLWKD